MEKMNCEQARQIDLVAYLASLGHRPARIKGEDHWYLSPLEKERTPSFKVDRGKNLWYDHSAGKGGNFIDFGILYFKCTVSDFLSRLNQPANLSFQPHTTAQQAPQKAGEKKEPDHSKIQVVEVRPLADKILLDYLESRKIPLDIAAKICKEVDFLLYERKHTVIGFENSSGGYELRGPDFKGSSSPKTVTHIDNNSGRLAVFEGFTDYLSFRTLYNDPAFKQPNYLILNSAAFFEKSRDLMEKYQQVNLYLDRDLTGRKNTLLARTWNKEKFIDWSTIYGKYKDLNEWLIKKDLPKLKQERKISRGL
jgi:hypothetical protein